MSGILSITKIDLRSEMSTSDLGKRGESLAADYIVRRGFRLVAANFKVPVGRNRKGVPITGEIDLIAIEGETLCFIEVKTRRSDEFTPVLSNVGVRKQRQITRTARVYRRIFGIRDIAWRFDVVTVLISNHTSPAIELTRGFWNESKFRKQRWSDRSWHEFP